MPSGGMELQFKTPYPYGTTHIFVAPLEFLQDLAVFVTGLRFPPLFSINKFNDIIHGTLNRWIDEGRFPHAWKASPQGGGYRIPRQDIERVKQTYLS